MRPIRSQHGLIVILAHVPQVARLIALATMLAGLSAVAFSWQPVPLPLPAELTEAEASALRRERSPKSHVEAALKASELRLGSALTLARQRQYQTATQQLVVLTSLIGYADQYSRSLPPRKRNDRDQCLKKIEQTIFRQNTRLESIVRELPFEFREESGPLIEQIRKIRLQAINDLLGGGAAIKLPE
jgi:hypothetical protein